MISAASLDKIVSVAKRTISISSSFLFLISSITFKELSISADAFILFLAHV